MTESTISVFLSYRRDDTRHVAGRLADRLQEHFEIFMDTDMIEPGMDFIEVIRREIRQCDVLLAVIGTGWTTSTDDRGRRRLDDPNDWVVEEIRVALERNIRVIPVLVDGASMPQPDEIPPVLSHLSSRQALTLRHETFLADTTRLVTAIHKVVRAAAGKPPLPTGEAPVVRDTGIPDAQDRGEDAKRRRLLADISSLSEAGQWTDVLAAIDELSRLDPTWKDPEGRANKARAELARQRTAARYAQGLDQFKNRSWAEAIATFETLWQDYADTARLIDIARQQLRLEQLDIAATSAASGERWRDAVFALEQITDIDPSYRDATTRLDFAREQVHRTGTGASARRGETGTTTVTKQGGDVVGQETPPIATPRRRRHLKNIRPEVWALGLALLGLLCSVATTREAIPLTVVSLVGSLVAIRFAAKAHVEPGRPRALAITAILIVAIAIYVLIFKL